MSTEIEDVNSGLQLALTLPTCNKGELIFLQAWAAAKAEKFPHFAKWLGQNVQDELGRREDELKEPGTVGLPFFSDGIVAGDFLLGAYVLANQPCTQGIAKFADDLLRKVVCDISGNLECLGDRYEV